jgi:hypothetical protein
MQHSERSSLLPDLLCAKVEVVLYTVNMKRIYEVLIFVSLAYVAWYIFATLTRDSSLFWMFMDLIGPNTVTIGMGIFAIVFVLLSFGNIVWIPALAREKRIATLLLHLIGVGIALILLVMGGFTLLG